MTYLKALPMLLLLSIASCYAPNPKSPASSLFAEEKTEHLTIDSLEEFERLSNKVDGASAVQFIYFYGLPSSDPLFGQIHFLDFSQFATHWDYVYKKFDRWKKSLENDYRLTSDVQQEVTGGWTFYRPAQGETPERLAYSFAYEVHNTAEDVKVFHTKLKQAMRFLPETAFVYLARSSSEVLAAEKLGLQAERLDDFFATTKNFVFYSEATSYGYLRRISPADLKAGRYSEKDILILDEIPLDLGPVSGVISSVPQVPNSHVILRCLNQKVPDLYLKKIPAYMKDFENKLIRLTVSSETSWYVEDISILPEIEKEAQKCWQERQKTIPTPDVDLSVNTLYSWRSKAVDPSLVKSYGAKASNFAILDEDLKNQGIDRSQYDQSFMVPFSFYAQHLEGSLSSKSCDKAAKKCLKDEGHVCTKALDLCQSIKSSGTINSFLTAMLEDQNRNQMIENPAHRREFLSFARRLIREVDLPAPVLSTIRDAMAAYPETRRMRLRSSTNAEDLSGLNGAGLYDSKAACLGDPEGADDDDGKPSACRTPTEEIRINDQVQRLRSFPDPSGELTEAADELEESLTNKYSLSDSIRAVYASIWTERAFLNREYYGLIHSKVYMGMLVHPSFIDESANGVAVVTFTAKGADLNIVAQADDVSITNPIFPGATPEQTIGTVNSEGVLLEFDIISRSTLKRDVIPSEVKRADLARQLYLAARALKKTLNKDRFDLEFMMDADQNVIIKQGRPL